MPHSSRLRARHDAVGAEAVQDGALREADLGGELRIGVERVDVAREAVEQLLARGSPATPRGQWAGRSSAHVGVGRRLGGARPTESPAGAAAR